jgi:transcription termination factor Rho
MSENASLGISENGIVFRPEDGPVVLVLPGKSGSLGSLVEVPDAIAEELSLSDGDVVSGTVNPLDEDAAHEHERATDEEGGQPEDVAGSGMAGGIPAWLATRLTPCARLVSVERVNGLPIEEARERPSPRQKRGSYERSVTDRHIPLGTGPSDLSGRCLDLAAPFGLGYVGLIYGPHASGLTRALQSVVRGVAEHTKDVLVIVLLLRSRGEEMTDWRRRFPEAEVMVCPSGVFGAAPDQSMRVADLTLECAKRQSELGRHVLLAVDSLSGLWAAMLECEDADAQREADQAYARQRMREWLQTAGNFGGEGFLGGGLGGSITIAGTVWHQEGGREGDLEAEEEGELHPHLRLLEHALHEAGWRVPLVGELADRRLFPAVDVVRAYSRNDGDLLGSDMSGLRSEAIKALARMETVPRYHALISALESHDADEAAWQALAASYEPPPGIAALFD